MAVVVMESISLWLSDRTRCRYTVLAEPAGKRIQRSAWRIATAMIVLAMLTLGPALAWRLRTGAWLDGSP
jgi:hypothetical protein